MAKFIPGTLASALSGSLGGKVFSHNRYGAYIRDRVIPTKIVNAYTTEIRAILTGVSQAWRALDADQQAAWQNWAQEHPIVDRLGQRQVLQGNAAYIMLNSRIVRCGLAGIDVPPVAQAPVPLTTITVTAAVAAPACEVAYTATPLGATEYLWVFAAVTDSPARKYVQNLLKLVHVSAAAAASPADILAELETRFGSLAIGQTVYVQGMVVDGATGLGSVRQVDSVLIAA